MRRRLIFEDNSALLKTSGNRPRGRPRAEWSKEVAFHAQMAAIGFDCLESAIGECEVWKRCVRRYCRD